MITIIDYGIGNVRAILNMLTYLDIEAQISGNYKDILSSSHLILPGIGSFDPAILQLKKRALIEPIKESVQHNGNNVLGICLGMQLLGLHSEEGDLPGLNLVKAYSVKLQSSADFKVPHIGWSACIPEGEIKLISKNSSFYFSHSYVVESNLITNRIRSTHGTEFLAGFEVGNIMGVQFHPERSSKNGFELLNRFAGT
jgi:glutamine amidotransferase